MITWKDRHGHERRKDHNMKAWPHTHIGIARDEYGLFIGERFLQGTGSCNAKSPIEQLVSSFPEAESAIIFPLEAGVRWELEEAKAERWVEKGEE